MLSPGVPWPLCRCGRRGGDPWGHIVGMQCRGHQITEELPSPPSFALYGQVSSVSLGQSLFQASPRPTPEIK